MGLTGPSKVMTRTSPLSRAFSGVIDKHNANKISGRLAHRKRACLMLAPRKFPARLLAIIRNHPSSWPHRATVRACEYQALASINCTGSYLHYTIFSIRTTGLRIRKVQPRGLDLSCERLLVSNLKRCGGSACDAVAVVGRHLGAAPEVFGHGDQRLIAVDVDAAGPVATQRNGGAVHAGVAIE